MKRKDILSLFLILVLLTLSLTIPSEASAASKIKLSATKATIYIGQSTTLKVTGTSQKITWSSSNKTIATVSSKGKVTAKKAGTCTITAKMKSKKLTCKVTVKKPVLSKTKLTLGVGSSRTLTITGATIKSCKSSDTKIATVNSKGKVTAKKIGTCTITITDTLKRTYKCKLTVTKSNKKEAMTAYYNFLKENAIDSYGNQNLFQLAYITDDDIPELLVTDETFTIGSYVNVYTYSNGKIIHIGQYGTYGELGFIEYTGKINAYCNSEIEEWSNYYEIKNNQSELVKYFEVKIEGEYRANWMFFINEKEVSQDTYYIELAKMTGYKYYGYGDYYQITENIMQVVLFGR